MREAFTLSSGAVPELRLRTIDAPDCDLLREWKNANRRSFFFQGLIDPEGQRRWFQSYLDRPLDFMFMVEADGEQVGCMGFRMLDGAVDVYNVIRGTANKGQPRLMSAAFRILCTYARTTFPASPLEARVLKSNPACRWYEKNGFRIVREEEAHYLMTLEEGTFQPMPLLRSEMSSSGDR